MHRTIVVAFATLDGIIEDPDGTGGMPGGGWMFRNGPAAVPRDPFKLGPLLDSSVLLLGRKTWQQFSRIWPNRSDDFSMALNGIPKLVASTSITDLSAWENSSLIGDDLLEAVAEHKGGRHVLVMGSASVVHTLAAHDLVDEYRIIVFPELVGRGTRLFAADTVSAPLRLIGVEQSGPTVLLRHERTSG